MSYKIHYFNFRGRAEPLRWILKLNNVNFDDCRYKMANWPNVKATFPFARLPVLEIDNVQYTNAIAGLAYLGKKFNLAGSDDLEALHITGVAMNVYDLIGHVEAVTYYYKDALGDNLQSTLTKLIETYPSYLKTLEEIAGKNGGFFNKGKLSWADIYFVATIEYINYMMVYMGRKESGDILAGYPNLTKLYKTVVGLKGIKEWIEERPEESEDAL